jgi:hypothetical protein
MHALISNASKSDHADREKKAATDNPGNPIIPRIKVQTNRQKRREAKTKPRKYKA